MTLEDACRAALLLIGDKSGAQMELALLRGFLCLSKDALRKNVIPRQFIGTPDETLSLKLPDDCIDILDIEVNVGGAYQSIYLNQPRLSMGDWQPERGGQVPSLNGHYSWDREGRLLRLGQGYQDKAVVVKYRGSSQPTGNIILEDFEYTSLIPMIAWRVCQSLGDPRGDAFYDEFRGAEAEARRRNINHRGLLNLQVKR